MSSKKQEIERQELVATKIRVAVLQTELDLREAHHKEIATITSILTTLREDIAAKNEQLISKDNQIQKLLPNRRSMIASLIVSVFFGVSTILFNLGNSLIADKKTNTIGIVIIGAAMLVYLGSAYMSLDLGKKG